MPLTIPDKLPAIKILEEENIFVMRKTTAIHQDIRPLKIVILNLMPVKITTETHILRLLSNTPLQVEVTLLHTTAHVSRNTPSDHLKTFYKTFRQIRNHKYDGMIITGAPIEHLDFEEVDYWDELKGNYGMGKTQCHLNHVHMLGCPGWFVSLLRNTQIPAAQKNVWYISTPGNES